MKSLKVGIQASWLTCSADGIGKGLDAFKALF